MHPDRIHLPPFLKRGDCIGLFSPSGPVRDQEKLKAGIRILHDLGFRTVQYPAPPIDHEYLAAEDKQRAREFQALWDDTEVHAMMAVRGGFGCLRMMPRLDLDHLRQAPKLLIGFSDLTVLLNSVTDRTGIMTVHGPVLTSLAGIDRESMDSFLTLITGNMPDRIAFPNLEILRGGTSSGILRGGNLTTISHLLGTPWEIPFRNTLLFLEDTGEPMYKIDRMLTQLYVSNRLEQLTGIMLGSFDLGEERNSNIRLREEIWKRVLELTAHENFPVWANIPIGHRSCNHALPIGMAATMDSMTGQIHLHDDYYRIAKS